MISRCTALAAGGAGVVAAAGGGVYLAVRDKPEPPAPASVDAQNHLLWRNWSACAYAYPAARTRPAQRGRSRRRPQDFHGPVRVARRRPLLHRACPHSGTLMTLDSLTGVAGWQGEEAVVWAGTRLNALGPALAQRGGPWPTCPTSTSSPWAGASARATHGTGPRSRRSTAT